MAQGSFDERYKLVLRKMSLLKAKQTKKPPSKRTRNVGKSKLTQLSTSSSTESPPFDNVDLPSTKLSLTSYSRALKDDPNMSKEQMETRRMFKNLGLVLHNFASLTGDATLSATLEQYSFPAKRLEVPTSAFSACCCGDMRQEHSKPGEMDPESFQALVMPKFDMHIHTSTLTTKELKDFPIPEKTDAQRNIEKPNPKIAEARKKKEMVARAKIYLKRARGESSGAPRKKKVCKAKNAIASGYEETTSVKPFHQASPKPTEKTTSSHSFHSGHDEENDKDTTAHRFVPNLGLRNDLRNVEVVMNPYQSLGLEVLVQVELLKRNELLNKEYVD
nr:hypothetical protein [Tanacetum cinerariifolium]